MVNLKGLQVLATDLACEVDELRSERDTALAKLAKAEAERDECRKSFDHVRQCLWSAEDRSQKAEDECAVFIASNAGLTDDTLKLRDELYARSHEMANLSSALNRANMLIAAMMSNDPNEPISDAGHVALDIWKDEADKLQQIYLENLYGPDWASKVQP